MPYVIATICARGGSRGVPGKNLRALRGRPLIAWAIECARASRSVDDIVVSTDSDEIARAAEACGVEVPFRRPREMATAEAGKLPAIRHAAAQVEARRGQRSAVVVDLDVTAPLRAPEDVDACVRRLRGADLDAVVSVYAPDRNPYFNMVELNAEGLAQPVKRPKAPLLRRQDAPEVWSISGAVFAFRRDFLDATSYVYDGRVGVVELPRSRAIDVDVEDDFQLLEVLAARGEEASGRRP